MPSKIYEEEDMYLKAKEEFLTDRDYSKVNPILFPSTQKRIKEVIADREDFWIQESLNVQPELIPGSYRYRLYIYSNLFEKNTLEGCNLTGEDKVMLVKIFKSLLDVHALNWVREKLFEIDEDKILALKNFFLKLVMDTKSFHELKVALYGLRMIEKREYVIDDYMIELIPALSKYVKEK